MAYQYADAPRSPVQQGTYRPSTAPAHSSSSSSSASASAFGRVSVANFNDRASVCLIDSPRSLAAMARLGIDGAELLYRAPGHRSFVEGVDAQTAELLPDYIQRRHGHYEAKRQAKLRALREERQAAIEDEQAGYEHDAYSSPMGAHRGSDSHLVAQARERASTALEMEKQEVARMQQRLLTKLNNTLAFEIRRAQTLDRAQSKVEYAQSRSEAERQARAQQQAEREMASKHAVAEQQRRLAEEAEERRRMNEEAWIESQRQAKQKQDEERERRRLDRMAQVDARNRGEEKRLQLEAIQEMQRQTIAAKEAELQRKENQRLAADAEQRRQQAEFNEAQQRYHRDKLEQAAHRAAQIAEQKRQRWTEKEMLAEQKRAEFEADRAWEREQMRLRGLQKEEQLRQAQAQADAIQRAKAEATLAKEQAAADRLAERERVRAMDEHERRAWQAERDAQRRQILEQSYEMREQRGSQILAKRAQLNARSNSAMRRREAEIRERKLAEQMLAEDRKEQVARMARVQAHQRDQLLQRIQSDRDRIDSLQQQSQQLAAERLKLRDMAERQQAELLAKFEKLKAHPERLRNLDPDHVDVVKMGFLSQEEAAQLLSFKSDRAHRTHTARVRTLQWLSVCWRCRRI